jgi:hypothetical protein
MASFIYQRKKEEASKVHTALANGLNPLSSEEAYFVETCVCCRNLGVECQDKLEQIGSEVNQWRKEEEIL